MTAARDRLVRVVAEALAEHGRGMAGSDGTSYCACGEVLVHRWQKGRVLAESARSDHQAEAVVAAIEAASIHDAVEKMRSNLEMARATYSTGPVEPTGDISRARERIGKFARGGRIERGQARPIEDGYPLTCDCGRHLPCRHCGPGNDTGVVAE